MVGCIFKVGALMVLSFMFSWVGTRFMRCPVRRDPFRSYRKFHYKYCTDSDKTYKGLNLH